jgi:hypothetical protein
LIPQGEEAEFESRMWMRLNRSLSPLVRAKAFNSTPSWPGLSRPSTSFFPNCSKVVDARDKPGHDGVERLRGAR